ncbi:MAG: hypothetical protein EXQ47_04110 [Bryobacterales bacterium]|nr:hypothetical protein [Bryobacterales bacterium]
MMHDDFDNGEVRPILQAAEAEAPVHISSRLQSRIFSKLIQLEQEQGALRVLSESRAAGERLCIFETVVAALPSDDLQSRNPCAVCHARILGERVEQAPIFWPGCPYAKFCGH